MLPFLLVVLGLAFLATGLWPVGLAAFVGAAVQWRVDDDSRKAEEACRAAGIDRTVSNIGFGCFDLVAGGLLVAAILFVLGVIA